MYEYEDDRQHGKEHDTDHAPMNPEVSEFMHLLRAIEDQAPDSSEPGKR